MFWLRGGFRFVAVLMAGLHVWAASVSQSMNPDGVAYLDIGDAYFRRDWSQAISTVWSPLYSWILGLVMWLFEPPMRWEFPTVHFVNFAIFLSALCTFEFFWRQLANDQQRDVHTVEGRVTWPEWAWWTIGYLLFIWVSLSLIQIWAVTPDLLMAALLFAASGVLVRIRAGRDQWQNFVLLGFILGLAYLSKSIMFPVSLVFLAASFVALAEWRRALPRTGLALLVFVVVIGPFVLLMSGMKGHFTYGDAGKFTYARHVNGVIYPHWQGSPEGDGVPVHPSRQIFDNPPIYEFGTPIGGTYPIAFDQTYWYEGVTTRFDWQNQVRQLLSSALYYTDLFIYQQAAILFGIILIYLSTRRPFSLRKGVRDFLLSIIGLTALLLYMPILVAGRYVGAFVLLFWSDFFAQAHLPNSIMAQRVFKFSSVLMTVFLTFNIFVFNVQGFADLSVNGARPAADATVARSPARPITVAEELWQLGIEPGDPVAVIGYGFDSFWARLARTKIVAELLGWQADPFWLGDSALQEEVLAAFAETGARAVVAEDVPSYAKLSGWHQIDDSSYYIYLLHDR